jgi:MFS family permease
MRRWLRETTGGLPRTFWVLWAGTLVNRASGFVFVFLAYYLTVERDLPTWFAGLVIGLGGAGGAVGVLLGGVLADRWGRRPTFLAGQLATAGSLVGLGLAVRPVEIAGWTLALGLSRDMVRPALGAMMVDVVPPVDRLRAFTLFFWAINLGFSISAVFAGVLARVDYLLLFALDAGVTVATAVVVFALVRETRPAMPAGGLPHVEGLGTVFRDPVFLTFVGLTMAIAAVLFQFLTTLPIAMAADGLDPTVYGLVVSLNGVLIVLGQLHVTRWTATARHARVLALAALLIGGGYGLALFADHAWMYAVTVLVWTAGEMLSAPTQSTVVAELSPVHLRGRYQGVFSFGFGVAAAVSPIAGGWVLDRLGSATLWLGSLALGLLVAAGHLAAAPARDRRLAALRDGQLSGAAQEAND